MESYEDQQLSMPSNLTVYPNPANELVNIAYTFREQGPTQLRVLDLAGKVLMEADRGNLISDRMELNTDLFPPGMYLITVSNGTEKLVQKLVINR